MGSRYVFKRKKRVFLVLGYVFLEEIGVSRYYGGSCIGFCVFFW